MCRERASKVMQGRAGVVVVVGLVVAVIIFVVVGAVVGVVIVVVVVKQRQSKCQNN